MNLAIVGTGLVSPIGLTPLQHACSPRAGIGLHPASAFVGADGEPVRVHHCPWLGAKLPVAERLAALASNALDSASERLSSIPDLDASNTTLLLCLGASRPGLTESDRQGAADLIARATSAPLRRVLTGAASFFAAIVEADRLIEAGEVRAVVLVAADSFVSLDAIRAELEAAPSAWVREPPPPSEAVAAIVVMKGTDARELGVSLATIHDAGVLLGAGSDEDDEVVDGSALSALLDRVPSGTGPIARVYGQDQVDRLRLTEWTCAAARQAERFHPQMTIECIESRTGRVGAAAGATHLVYGVAAERHHAAREHPAGVGPCMAWAASRDGTRGACAATAGET